MILAVLKYRKLLGVLGLVIVVFVGVHKIKEAGRAEANAKWISEISERVEERTKELNKIAEEASQRAVELEADKARLEKDVEQVKKLGRSLPAGGPVLPKSVTDGLRSLR